MRTGQWFKARGLMPTRVRSSPWCRCRDTATLAALRQAVVMAAAQRGRFEVWVTPMRALTDLVSTNTASGEGLVSKADAASAIQVLASLPAA